MNTKELLEIKEILLKPIQTDIKSIKVNIECIEKKVDELRTFKTRLLALAGFVSALISGAMIYFFGKD